MNVWLDNHLYLIYQVYGAAFLMMGAVALVVPRQNRSSSMQHLWLLGIFGLLHGLQEFVDAERMFGDYSVLTNISHSLTVSSFAALFEFGRRSLNLAPVPAYALAATLAVAIGLWGREWSALAAPGARYAFGFGGAVLVAAAFLRTPGSQDAAWYRTLGISFAVYAVLTLFVDTTAIPAHMWLPSHAWFNESFGIPVQLGRAVCALAALCALVVLSSRANTSTALDLENILQGIDGFVYRCRNDKSWSLVYMAGNVHEISGHDIEDFTDPDRLTLASWIHENDRDRVWDEVQQALAQQQKFLLNYRIVTKSGELRWVSERGAGVYDNRGELLFLQGHVSNANELVSTLERLERSEQLAGLAHWELAVQNGDGLWSRQMYRFFNISHNDGVPDQARFLELLHPQDRESVSRAMQAMMQGQAPEIVVFRSNPDMGPVKYFLPGWQCLRGADGQPVRFTGTVLDITSQQLAMQQLEASRLAQNEALALAQREQGRMAALLSAMSIGILFEDREGLVEYVNPAFRRMWAVDENIQLVGDSTRRVLEHSTHRFARPDHASKHVLHVLDTHEISERFEVDLYDGRILTQLSYPVSDTDGRIIGRLWIYEDVTHERQTAQQLVYLAEHDPLTGLNNRHRFQEQLDWLILSARRNRTRFAVLYFDLDDFKYINDTFGHRAGDTVLVRTAGEVASLVRAGEMFARLGGDEFAILTELQGKDTPIALAERICHAIASIPFRFRGSNLRLTTSIGITIFPEHGDNTEDLIAHADSAMYQAKNAGKNNWAIYDAARNLPEHMIARMNWVTRIAHGLENDLLELHFQGIHRTSDRTLSHLEVLVRMKDPDRPNDLIMPGQFIPIAEKSGQILEIDRWVLKHSIAALASHASLNALAVNISGRSFDEPGLPNYIHDLFQEYQVAPERLIIELTETAAVSEMQDAQRFIEKLQKTGCVVCLDDFGTGFSTFAYLKYLGVQVLKIDGMFIRDLPNNKDNQAFVKAMIDVGKGLNKITVAEFVEDEATFDMLKTLGVDLAQGYYLDRPCADHPALSQNRGASE